MISESCIVLLSGGQDSSTCLYWAKENFKNVHAICFDYGQRHLKEIEIALKIAETANVPIQTISLRSLFESGNNALINKDISIEETYSGTFPNTFVPGRNMVFLTMAAINAYEKGIHNLVIGVSQTDYSGYPDCREPFISSIRESLQLAMGYDFEIHTPLMHLDKKGTWALADKMGVLNIIRNHTLTCYEGIPADGCGKCPACKLRKQGLKDYLKN